MHACVCICVRAKENNATRAIRNAQKIFTNINCINHCVLRVVVAVVILVVIVVIVVVLCTQLTIHVRQCTQTYLCTKRVGGSFSYLSTSCTHELSKDTRSLN